MSNDPHTMVDNSRTEPDFCQFQTYPGSWFDPPEYCPNHAEPDEDFCADHLPTEEDFEKATEPDTLDPFEDVAFYEELSRENWERYEGDTE